jgi:hypothetical protein
MHAASFTAVHMLTSLSVTWLVVGGGEEHDSGVWAGPAERPRVGFSVGVACCFNLSNQSCQSAACTVVHALLHGYVASFLGGGR